MPSEDIKNVTVSVPRGPSRAARQRRGSVHEYVVEGLGVAVVGSIGSVGLDGEEAQGDFEAVELWPSL